MSRAFFYKCDGCEKPTNAKPHIVLAIGHTAHSGIAMPPESKWNTRMSWYVYQNIDQGVYHFHNPACVAKWFGLKLDTAIEQQR